MRYTGIDPGMKGAIAVLTSEDVLSLDDMPMVRGWYNPQAIRLILNAEEQTIGLEESFRFPKLCKGIGILWAIGELAPRSNLVMVLPVTWQRFHGIQKADKNVSIDIARQLFPSEVKKLSLKMHHNRAEALLIAEWVRRKICHI